MREHLHLGDDCHGMLFYARTSFPILIPDRPRSPWVPLCATLPSESSGEPAERCWKERLGDKVAQEEKATPVLMPQEEARERTQNTDSCPSHVFSYLDEMCRVKHRASSRVQSWVRRCLKLTVATCPAAARHSHFQRFGCRLAERSRRTQHVSFDSKTGSWGSTGCETRMNQRDGCSCDPFPRLTLIYLDGCYSCLYGRKVNTSLLFKRLRQLVRCHCCTEPSEQAY